jgi:adenine-specific DNA-methyltransferase
VTQAYDKLNGLLKELFQFDREDLDFGIYRIMNHKREEILNFLDRDLLPQVQEAFSEYRAGDETQVREQLTTLEKTLGDAGVTAESSPKYLALKESLEETKDLSALENEVYSDLYTFFRRYYKNGDFLSLRRYKPGVYAVPYEGEEVKLHWANADQYYVKTAENFRNYRFELEGVGHVNFDLVSAATERDNNKAANGKERRFVLREEDPVEETDGELHIYFEYRPHPDKQETLREQARDAIFENVSGEWETGLAEPKPTPGNKKRTLLEKHLAEYTARNTFDYFIHKDLGGFLRRELDFFLKSEVLHIDDLDTDNEQRVEQYLS